MRMGGKKKPTGGEVSVEYCQIGNMVIVKIVVLLCHLL